MKLTVFCASSSKVDIKYFDATKKIAEIMAKQGLELLYGAGAVGLMGCLADELLAQGGKITGIIPHFMQKMEWAHKGISNLELVDDMHERKKQLIMRPDAILSLPGGCGTLDELLEAITLKQLGQINIPIIILNAHGFYDGLLEVFEKMIEGQFMRPEHRNIWTVIDEPDELMHALNNSQDWDGSNISMAQI